MKCNSCSSEMEKSWRFCPKCGHTQNILFDRIETIDKFMNKMMKGMHSMDALDRQAEVFDISPAFMEMQKDMLRGAGKSGFTVRINQVGGKPPFISVKTFGNVDKDKLKDRLQKKFGIRLKQHVLSNPRNELKIPGNTEEPRSIVKRLAYKVIVDVELPNVKSLSDINIKELESSVEIKAVAGDKGYFKIFTKPAHSSITKKEFKNGVLRLEFS